MEAGDEDEADQQRQRIEQIDVQERLCAAEEDEDPAEDSTELHQVHALAGVHRATAVPASELPPGL